MRNIALRNGTLENPSQCEGFGCGQCDYIGIQIDKTLVYKVFAVITLILNKLIWFNKPLRLNHRANMIRAKKSTQISLSALCLYF